MLFVPLQHEKVYEADYNNPSQDSSYGEVNVFLNAVELPNKAPNFLVKFHS